MKSKWKYGNQLATGNWQWRKNLQLRICNLPIASCLLSVAYCLLLIAYSSCNTRDKHKHIPTNKTNDLDGLAQPSNQVVFSDVKTISPKQQSIAPTLNATGIISYDPQLLNNISARYSGRIEKLYVRFNFENVTKGQRLMDIYSPEILTAQQNLVFLLMMSVTDDSLINSSIRKLQLLGLTDDQINTIKKTKQPINPLPFYSPYNGHIHDIGLSGGITNSLSVNSNMGSGMNSSQASSQLKIENLPSSQTSELTIKEGMYLQSGQPVFSIYNTNRVWAVLNIFPQDASLIKGGEKVSITAETNPGNLIYSTISYIEPVAGQNASSIKARVYLQNGENLHLKIGTLVTAKITTKEISGLWLPRNAVVNLGPKQIVFQKNENHFVTKTIRIGIVADSLVQVISGLTGNENIAVNAQFMVDSESFIETDNHEVE